jgi:hypothetical protein
MFLVFETSNILNVSKESTELDLFNKIESCKY